MLVWFIHDRPGQAEGVALSLTETKYKLRWKQKFLRVQSLTYLVFSLFFLEAKPSQNITLAMA